MSNLFRYGYNFFRKSLVYTPKEPVLQVNKEPRIALCLFGLVGGIKSKNNESILGSQEVLELGFKHYDEHFFKKNPNIDVFVHTWSTELEKPILELYHPKSALFEKQKQFKTSELMEGTEQRKIVHYSMTYSIKNVIELKAKYERENNIKYDFVFLSRFDVAWNEDFIFRQFDPQYFYAAKWYSRLHKFFPLHIPIGYPYTSIGIADLWFFSNSDNMNLFSTLYDHLEEYAKPGQCPPTKFGVSFHNLTSYHLSQKGLAQKLRFYGKRIVFTGEKTRMSSKETSPLVRRKYFDCKV
ncbi:hypothetical protein HYT55_01790 [Candidatus Woesearchaeota archaeon]|nr:hypothetical protein [Candidatus Woesearchaeota archaeon]